MQPKRILVITKDDSLASQVEDTLRKTGYQVWRARDGTEGLKTLQKVSPDLVIMEREEFLPVNSRDSFSRIRQASYVPIIAVGSDQDPTDMLEFGADVYMSKPPSMMEFAARVRALLRRKNMGVLPANKYVMEHKEIFDGTN